MSGDIKGIGVFSPCSKAFKQAEKIFHKDLAGADQVIVVAASIFGGVFFIVGGFAAFCWTVKALQSSEIATVQTAVDDVLPITNVVKKDFSDFSVVKGSRFREDHFNKFLEETRQHNLRFRDLDTETEPGSGEKVIVFDYWGRPGGELQSPFSDTCEASVFYVVVGRIKHQESMLQEQIGRPVLVLDWDPLCPFEMRRDTADELKEFLGR